MKKQKIEQQWSKSHPYANEIKILAEELDKSWSIVDDEFRKNMKEKYNIDFNDDFQKYLGIDREGELLEENYMDRFEELVDTNNRMLARATVEEKNRVISEYREKILSSLGATKISQIQKQLNDSKGKIQSAMGSQFIETQAVNFFKDKPFKEHLKKKNID